MTACDVLRMYEQWEANLLNSDNHWEIPEELMDELLEIQKYRNFVLESMGKTQEKFDFIK